MLPTVISEDPVIEEVNPLTREHMVGFSSVKILLECFISIAYNLKLLDEDFVIKPHVFLPVPMVPPSLSSNIIGTKCDIDLLVVAFVVSDNSIINISPCFKSLPSRPINVRDKDPPNGILVKACPPAGLNLTVTPRGNKLLVHASSCGLPASIKFSTDEGENLNSVSPFILIGNVSDYA